MDVSIIIPVYQVEPYIEVCLQSVAAQDFTGTLECILVDDCGNDRSVAIAERFITGYTGPVGFTLLHHRTNRGQSAARNTAMQVARGKYLYFLDSDDLITPDCIRLLYARIEGGEYDLAVGGFRTFGGKKTEQSSYTCDYDLEQCDTSIYSMVCGKLYRSGYLQSNAIRFPEGITNEDELLFLMVATTARHIAVVSKETYLYRRREDSTTGAMSSLKNIENIKCVLLLFGQYLRERNICNLPAAFVWYKRYSRSVLIRSWQISLALLENNYKDIKKCFIYNPTQLLRFACVDHLYKDVFLCLHWVLPTCIGMALYRWVDAKKINR